MKTKAILTNYFKAITNVASQSNARSEPSPCRKRLMPCIQKPRAGLSKVDDTLGVWITKDAKEREKHERVSRLS